MVSILLLLAFPAAAQTSPTLENRLRTIERGELRVTATGATTARALNDWFADTYNVKGFTGASVTARIDAAVAAAVAAGGGTVLIPGHRGRRRADVPSSGQRPNHRPSRRVQGSDHDPGDPGTSAFGKAQGLKLLTSGYGDSMLNPNRPDFVNLYSFIDSIGPGYALRGPIWSENLLAGVNWQHDTQAWGSEIDVNNDAQIVGEP